jgi:hypothetical protein
MMVGPPPDLAQISPRMSSPRLASRPRGSRASLFVLLLLILAGGGYFGYLVLFPSDETPAKEASRGADKPAPPKAGEQPAATKTGSAAPAPSTPAPTPGQRAEPGDLAIHSKPEGARVYLDGAAVGRTPIKIESTADRHKLAIIAPGYKPHVAEIEGRGAVSVELEEVTPPNGPAGIKIRCKQKNRYYVTLDGAPTGQLCPTERLGVELGEHTAEIYDPVTDSRRIYKVQVGQTRLSVRVRVD